MDCCFLYVLRLTVFFAGFLTLTGCMSNHSLLSLDSQETTGLSMSRQKQRIALLQKKLEFAEKNLITAQEEVENLSRELHQSQLSLIAKQVETYESQIYKQQIDPVLERKNRLNLDKNGMFFKERELLQEMMASGPSPESFEAQIVLDKMLRLITEFKDVEDVR